MKSAAQGLIPLATPFSLEDVDEIEALDLPGIKIASPDIVNWPLLRRRGHGAAAACFDGRGEHQRNQLERRLAARLGIALCFASLHQQLSDAGGRGQSLLD